MIEVLLEDILNKIQQKTYNAPKQLSEELGRLIIRDYLTSEQYAYCSSKIFNSDLNLFAFVMNNCLDSDRIGSNLRKEILEIIGDYLQVARGYLINYLVFIKDSSLAIFKKDISQNVKESALKIVVRILQSYDASILDPIIQADTLRDILIQEVTKLKPSPSVKGRIWQILGELIRKFYAKMIPNIFEIQELSFYEIKKMMEDGKNVEIKTLKGLLQLTRAILEVQEYPVEESKLGL